MRFFFLRFANGKDGMLMVHWAIISEKFVNISEAIMVRDGKRRKTQHFIEFQLMVPDGKRRKDSILLSLSLWCE